MILTIDKIIIFLSFFFGENVIGFIGIDLKLFQALIIIVCVIPISYYLKSWKNNVGFIYLFLLVIIYSAVQLVTDKGEGTRQMALTLLGAPLIVASVPNPKASFSHTKQLFWMSIMMIVFYSYLIETGLAIFERLRQEPLFGWRGEFFYSMDATGEISYRSYALYGHPLGNSLIVSTAMFFILISSLMPKYKFLLWGVGFLAVLCFNSRSGIVGNGLALIVYILYNSLSENVKSSIKSSYLLGGWLFVIGAFFAVFQLGLGGRLMDMGLMDESSSQTRIDALNLLDYGVKGFLLGHTFEEALSIKAQYGLMNLENPWLGILLRNGLVFLVVYVLLYYLTLKYLLRDYKLFDKLFVSVCFLLMASTNNSFDSNSIFLTYFMILSICFNPHLFKRIIGKRYLQESL